MTPQKYSDEDLKFMSPKKNDDGSYTITVKSLLDGHFATKDVNQFVNTNKLWEEFLKKSK